MLTASGSRRILCGGAAPGSPKASQWNQLTIGHGQPRDSSLLALYLTGSPMPRMISRNRGSFRI